MSGLVFESHTRYHCTCCGTCCSARWAVHATDEEKATIEALPWDEVDDPPPREFTRVKDGLWKLGKQADGLRCAYLAEDDRCVIHGRWGMLAKPSMCRRFPWQEVASDEKVWVSASYGCPGVVDGLGTPLAEHAEDVRLVCERQLSELREGASVRYPLSGDQQAPDAEISAAFAALQDGLGEDLFQGLRQLAAFAEHAPELGEPEPAQRLSERSQIPAALGYAFAFTLYADVVDPTRLLDRIKAERPTARKTSRRGRRSGRKTT